MLGEQGRHAWHMAHGGPDVIHPVLDENEVMIVLQGRYVTVTKREAVERHRLSWY